MYINLLVEIGAGVLTAVGAYAALSGRRKEDYSPREMRKAA